MVLPHAISSVTYVQIVWDLVFILLPVLRFCLVFLKRLNDETSALLFYCAHTMTYHEVSDLLYWFLYIYTTLDLVGVQCLQSNDRWACFFSLFSARCSEHSVYSSCYRKNLKWLFMQVRHIVPMRLRSRSCGRLVAMTCMTCHHGDNSLVWVRRYALCHFRWWTLVLVGRGGGGGGCWSFLQSSKFNLGEVPLVKLFSPLLEYVHKSRGVCVFITEIFKHNVVLYIVFFCQRVSA